MKTPLEVVLQKDWEKQHNLKPHHNTEQNGAIRGRTRLLDEITEGGGNDIPWLWARGKTEDSDKAKPGHLTLTVSRALSPLIYHDSHTLPLISADKRPDWNRLNFLS